MVLPSDRCILVVSKLRAYYCSTLVDLPNVWCHVNSKLLYTLSICLPIPAEIIYIIYNVDNTRRCIIVRHYGTMGSKISYIFFNQFSRQLFYCNNNGTIGLRCTFNQTIGIVMNNIYIYTCFEFHSDDVFSIQHYMIKFVSDWRQVGGFFMIAFTNTTDRHNIAELLLKVALNTITQNLFLLLEGIMQEYRCHVVFLCTCYYHVHV